MWQSQQKKMPKIKVQKWEERALCHMRCIAQRDLYLQTFARKTTGFTEEDLELLWDAIINMFENDHSAARGKMAVRELIVFKHSKELGDCPAYKLFDAVEVTRKEDVEYPRRYQDYIVEVHDDKIPESVEVKRMI